MTLLLAILVWSALGLLAYSYVLYPMLIARFVDTSNSEEHSASASAYQPSVTVVVAAFNEERHIRARIENLLSQRYPADRLDVHVGSDGSQDGTAREVAAVMQPRVHFHDFELNRGKASVLNDLIAACNTDLVVLTDANTEFEPDTIQRLVKPFEDPSIGAVCGELRLVAAGAGSNRDHEYWSVEQRLKLAESKIGGLLGANGGVYAIRRELYVPLSADTICDDFIIAMNVATRGRRVVYEPRALAIEDVPQDMSAEFHRRVRIGIGNYQALFRFPEYLFRTGPVRAFTYVSHKVIRWLTPHLLLLALAASLALAPMEPYRTLAGLQIAGYLALIVMYVTRRTLPWPRLLASVLFVAVLNAAFAVAFVRFLTGNYRGGWRRTER